jgi:hypothetical protein
MSAAREPGDDPPEIPASAGRRYVVAGLEVLGVDAGEDEIAVIEAVDAVYGPSLEALLADEFDGILHEPGADMSKPPRTESER